MSTLKITLAVLVTGAVLAGTSGRSQAAPLPTHFAAMKSMAATNTMQVRWGGWGGGWRGGGWGHGGWGHRPFGWGAAAAGALIGGALVSGAYYGSYYGSSYPAYGYGGYGGGYSYDYCPPRVGYGYGYSPGYYEGY
jgi:hypothetical protein